MQHRIVEKLSLLPVAPIGFGVGTVATPRSGINNAAAVRLLCQAFERGINVFDTADVYANGNGETLLAEALANHRDKIVLCTKFGYNFYAHPQPLPEPLEHPQTWTPTFVRRACEESLRRLRTDRIDLYQLHHPTLSVLESQCLFTTLDDLKREGKIRQYGAVLGSGFEPERQIGEGAYCINGRHIPVQIVYNLSQQEIGRELFPYAQWEEVPMLVRMPHLPRFDTHTKDKGRTIAQTALQFVLREPAVACVFPSISNEVQLDESVAALDITAFVDKPLFSMNGIWRGEG